MSHRLRASDDKYFTQTLLPDYLDEHPAETAAWDVVFDARGHCVEPHTMRSVPLGTLEVRQYLGERPEPERPAALDPGSMSPTVGPTNRYSTVLFVEKEGFDPLLAAAQIAERFDLAIMSTKGMSVIAARMLLDRLAPQIERVLVLHDFDVAGFSIFGTLSADTRRYRFENEVRFVDLGLRLSDVHELDLQTEPVKPFGENEWHKRAATLREHGATRQEIAFLRQRRVELNAMTADVFVAFLERKLAGLGVRKLIPGKPVLEQHARRVLERALANQHLDTLRAEIKAKAAGAVLPANLPAQVAALLKREPALPWDIAVARVVSPR